MGTVLEKNVSCHDAEVLEVEKVTCKPCHLIYHERGTNVVEVLSSLTRKFFVPVSSHTAVFL